MIKKLIRKEYDRRYRTVRDNLYMAKCFRCGHEWIPRVELIKTCAKCRSPYWDKAKDQHSFNKMRRIAALLVQNAKYRQFMRKATDEKCVDCGKKAVHWEHRNYARPLLVEPVCRSCNIKRGRANN